MTSRVLLAFPDTAAPQAQRVASQLGALGYEVGVLKPKARRTTEKVVMLWSRAAWGTPALRAAARRAHAAGKLVCIRLDAAPPPISGARVSTLPRGRADRAKWRQLLNPKRRQIAPVAQMTKRPAIKPRAQRAQRAAIAPATPPIQDRSTTMKEKNSRGFAIALTLTLIAIGATGYAYQRNADVAARIDGAAASVYAEASKWAALAP